MSDLEDTDNSTELPRELLDWVNRTLAAKFTRIEELCTGAAYCQLFHILYPDSITLEKVRFFTNLESHSEDNLYLLQRGFYLNKVDKIIPINQIKYFSFVPNYDFILWFKQFLHANVTSKQVLHEYNALSERSNQPIGYGAPEEANIADLMFVSSTENPTNISKEWRAEMLRKLNEETKKFEAAKVIGKRVKEERNFYYKKLTKIRQICMDNASNKTYIPDILKILNTGVKEGLRY